MPVAKRLAALFVLWIMLLLQSCSQPKQLVYQDVRNFRIRNLSFSDPEIGLDLQFYNPNDFGLTLKDALLNIYINDRFVGKAVLTQTFNVPRKDTFLMPVALTANLKSIFSNALLLIFNQPVDVRISGTVKAGRGLFLNIPVEYKGRQKLQVF